MTIINKIINRGDKVIDRGIKIIGTKKAYEEHLEYVSEWNVAELKGQKNLAKVKDLTPEQLEAFNQYWSKYEFMFKPDLLTCKVYTELSGIFNPRYIPAGLYVGVLRQLHHNKKFDTAYKNKNKVEKLVPDFRHAEAVVRRIKGIYLDKDFRQLTLNEAVRKTREHLNDFGEFVIKPTVGGGAVATNFIKKDITDQKLREMFKNYGRDFIAQKTIKQHESFSAIHPSSVQTLRIYSIIHRQEVKVLAARLRMGASGSRVDNTSLGGISCLVKENGVCHEYGVDADGNRVTEHPNGFKFPGFKIPNYDKVIDAVKKTHIAVPQLWSLAWDITLDEEGEPLFVEYNTRGQYALLQAGGVPLYGDITDEILDEALKLYYIEKSNWNYDYREYHDHIRIVKYAGWAKKVEIPAEIDGKPVTFIGESAFADNRKVVEIVMPDTVKRVEKLVFAGCSRLKRLTLSRNIKKIPFALCRDCKSLQEVVISENVREIPPSSFKGVTKAVFKCVKDSAAHKFAKKQKLAVELMEPRDANKLKKRETKQSKDFQYAIAGDVIIIEKYLGAERIVNLPMEIDGVDVKVIGEQVFANSSVEKVRIPDTVTSLGKQAFAHCESLTEVALPEGLNLIGAYCFEGCTKLEKVVLPETLITIYKGAFKNCESLKEIEMSEAMTVLNAETFFGCRSLEKVGLSYDLERICSSTFEGCTNLKEFYYFSKRGISAVMVTDRTLREAHLPTNINYMGEAAFKDCASLEMITIPYLVKVINQSVFEGCRSLKNVHIHNRLTTIKEKAFIGCTNLTEIKLPMLVKKIDDNVFESNTTIVAERVSQAYKYAKKKDILSRPLTKLEEMPQLSSQMQPSGATSTIDLDQHKPFYNETELTQIVEKYEMRQPSYDLIERPSLQSKNPVQAARYELKDGVYVNKNKMTSNRAVIMMTGDLMCRYRQQKFVFKDGSYNFDNGFWFVKDLLGQADFTVGNMETMISPSAPFTSESEHVNARPHLNAPESFLGAVRNASFDAVVNAQNHVYDTGTLGIMETLDLQNKYELMHAGAYASAEDKRYILAEVNGIKVAVLTYLDGARQLMKKANFTKVGREVLLNIYSEEQVKEDVANAKAEGAEFIIAFCHWGREYTHDLTDRQVKFSKEVANAGVDYIFGAHSHCVQPHEILTTNDGRQVPVIYSGGNFFSDINIAAPITRDTLIAELTLEKTASGEVKIVKNGYYPCRIMELGETDKDYAVIPTNVKFAARPVKTKSLMDAEARIVEVMGNQIEKLVPNVASDEIDLKDTPFNN